MKIGVLGSGDVGQVLGRGFAGLGHDVMMGTRDPKQEKVAAWVAKTGAHASAGTFAEAAQFGELIVLATMWGGTKSAIDLAGASHFAGKVVVDATNPLAMTPTGPSLAIGHNDSGGEQVQRWLPGAKVVKCWNTVGNAHMVHPKFADGKPDMFLCGDDGGAKKIVAGIVEQFGWGAIDLGGLDGARLLEPMCIAWVRYGVLSGGWNHAFKLLRA